MDDTSKDIAEASVQDEAPVPEIMRVKKYSRNWDEGFAPINKRGAVIALVDDSAGNISACYRTEFGDVTFIRDEGGEAGVVGVLRRIGRCRTEYMPYEQIWVLREKDDEDHHFYYGLEKWGWENCFPKKWQHPVRSVSLSLLEAAFGRPVESIARLARHGQLGFAPDASLSNVDSVAAALTVFAQQLA